ncbi:MAG: molybdopterin-binding protein [Peptococcales bacterium]
MKAISVYDAEGMVLCHDITEIVPGQIKGRAFKKGHVIKKEDIPKLLDLGKTKLYVWEINKNDVHENEAAVRIAKAATGPGIYLTEPVEGKVELKAQIKGLLKINILALQDINEVSDVILASIHSNQVVNPGKTVAGCRVIPLVVNKSIVERVEQIGAAHQPVFQIKPLRKLKIGVVTTGSEVYHGRIEDKFGPVIKQKILEMGSEFLRQIYVDDNVSMIAEAIQALINEGAEMVITTGGMSVDPDDVTPSGIKATGGRVVIYGAPVLPGAMFMLSYIGNVPVLGLPGCVMYHRTTIFDLIFPRVLAGEKITRRDITGLAHGGLCSVCKTCRYPDCPFGKGS